MPDMSFGVYINPRSTDHGRDLLLRMEDTEFDTAWVGDTMGDWRDRSAPMLDTWVTLGAMANETEEIELGMLVTNLAWRDPVHVARFAMTIDQLSDGRFVLGLGCGQLEDQLMAGKGAFDMTSEERLDRLEEGVQVIDRLLRQDVSDFQGTYSEYSSASMAPGCIQEPRLPIVVAGNSKRTMRIAVSHADTWNTWIDNGDADEFQAQTIQRIAQLDEYLADAGRASESLTRSLLVFDDVMDPWASNDAIPKLVDKFQPLGFTEFIFYPPSPDQMRDFLRIGVGVLSQLRD
ncbi:MAG TPA: LLM class flavin-dependent oxidoreductase [Actinomycetes bacterium]|nr:LLM class flavin-dependent oxidoreductase [Actinomycetes bacterium]